MYRFKPDFDPKKQSFDFVGRVEEVRYPATLKFPRTYAVSDI